MYENVWVEPGVSPLTGQAPPLPPRLTGMSGTKRPEEARETKTGRLEEIFNTRKMSQESLTSHASGSGENICLVSSLISHLV